MKFWAGIFLRNVLWVKIREIFVSHTGDSFFMLKLYEMVGYGAPIRNGWPRARHASGMRIIGPYGGVGRVCSFSWAVGGVGSRLRRQREREGVWVSAGLMNRYTFPYDSRHYSDVSGCD